MAVVALVQLLSAGGGGHAVQALGSEPVNQTEHPADRVGSELSLLQLSQSSELDAQSKSKLSDFIELDQDAKEKIMKTLRNDDLTQTETSLQWGFLKNIVNLDRLLVGGVSADQFDSDAGDCTDEAPQDEMPRIAASLKPDAV